MRAGDRVRYIGGGLVWLVRAVVDDDHALIRASDGSGERLALRELLVSAG